MTKNELIQHAAIEIHCARIVRNAKVEDEQTACDEARELVEQIGLVTSGADEPAPAPGADEPAPAA